MTGRRQIWDSRRDSSSNTSFPNAVTGPTLGWIISSRAPGRSQACSLTRWFSFYLSLELHLHRLQLAPPMSRMWPQRQRRYRALSGFAPQE